MVNHIYSSAKCPWHYAFYLQAWNIFTTHLANLDTELWSYHHVSSVIFYFPRCCILQVTFHPEIKRKKKKKFKYLNKNEAHIFKTNKMFGIGIIFIAIMHIPSQILIIVMLPDIFFMSLLSLFSMAILIRFSLL